MLRICLTCSKNLSPFVTCMAVFPFEAAALICRAGADVRTARNGGNDFLEGRRPTPTLRPPNDLALTKVRREEPEEVEKRDEPSDGVDWNSLGDS